MTPGREKKEQNCSGMGRGGLEDVVERMTKKGKMRLGGGQERLRVQRQTVREEVSQ